jgi:hypothetical protein
MSSQHEHDERTQQIAALLLASRSGTEDWGEISHLNGRPCSNKVSNKFLLCCLLDYQMDSNIAWRNGYRLGERDTGRPRRCLEGDQARYRSLMGYAMERI